jgi:hypothetical protein
MIRERVNAGIVRAKDAGIHCGRHPIAFTLEQRIRDALASPGRPGLQKIAKQFGVGTGTGAEDSPATRAPNDSNPGRELRLSSPI